MFISPVIEVAPVHRNRTAVLIYMSAMANTELVMRLVVSVCVITVSIYVNSPPSRINSHKHTTKKKNAADDISTLSIRAEIYPTSNYKHFS